MNVSLLITSRTVVKSRLMKKENCGGNHSFCVHEYSFFFSEYRASIQSELTLIIYQPPVVQT